MLGAPGHITDAAFGAILGGVEVSGGEWRTPQPRPPPSPNPYSTRSDVTVTSTSCPLIGLFAVKVTVRCLPLIL
jgi:hypothetical protein